MKRKDQKMPVDHGVLKPAWWTEEKWFGNMELCLSRSLVVEIKVIITTLLGLFGNVKKNLGCLQEKAFRSAPSSKLPFSLPCPWDTVAFCLFMAVRV